jgi:adenylate kinase family enzyme
VHDQVFALESRVGAIKGAIHLDCDYDMRVARTGAKLPGEIQQLRDRIDTFRREKVPVFTFFEKLGRAFTVNTTKKTSDEVFEAVRPFLE